MHTQIHTQTPNETIHRNIKQNLKIHTRVQKIEKSQGYPGSKNTGGITIPDPTVHHTDTVLTAVCPDINTDSQTEELNRKFGNKASIYGQPIFDKSTKSTQLEKRVSVCGREQENPEENEWNWNLILTSCIETHSECVKKGTCKTPGKGNGGKPTDTDLDKNFDTKSSSQKSKNK